MTQRILVVEDSRTQAEALTALLEENGYFVATRADGASALQYLDQERSDLVLCDVVMPGIDGYEVCRRIRNQPALVDLPVVLLTSLSDPLAIVQALECGADSYVAKPYDRDRLLSRVSFVLGSAGTSDRSRDSEPVEITVSGKPLTIRASKTRILDLCVASYEDLVASSDATLAAERRARFLAEAGGVLPQSLDADAILETLARLCVPAIADLAVVDVLDEGRERAVRRVFVKHSDPAKQALADRLRVQAIDLDAPSLVRDALKDGIATLESHVTREILDARSSSPGHRDVLEGLGMSSFVVVPIIAREQILGSLFFASTENRRLGELDLALARELANIAGLALDNAQLYLAAKQASRARDDMLAIVSHDLRNPLHTITMSAGLLKDMHELPGAELPLEEQLAVIRRAAYRANALIGDLLDVTRIEAGRLAIEASRQPAAPLLEDAVSEAKSLTTGRDIQIVSESQIDEPVCADRARIGQVFSNLTGNAIKFTPAGGRIAFSAERVDDTVRFSIRDTGVGIPPDDVAKVFDRFWQAERASRKGAGLGLFISRGIVEAHGGRIGVQSTVGQGTSFWFTIPVARGDSGEGASVPEEPGASNP